MRLRLYHSHAKQDSHCNHLLPCSDKRGALVLFSTSYASEYKAPYQGNNPKSNRDPREPDPRPKQPHRNGGRELERDTRNGEDENSNGVPVPLQS